MTLAGDWAKQRAGRAPESVALLQQTTRDEAHGRASMNVLAMWDARKLAMIDAQGVYEVSLVASEGDGSHQ
jgi:hypothetical protein